MCLSLSFLSSSSFYFATCLLSGHLIYGLFCDLPLKLQLASLSIKKKKECGAVLCYNFHLIFFCCVLFVLFPIIFFFYILLCGCYICSFVIQCNEFDSPGRRVPWAEREVPGFSAQGHALCPVLRHYFFPSQPL